MGKGTSVYSRPTLSALCHSEQLFCREESAAGLFSHQLSCCCDSANEVLLLRFALGTDGKRVEHTQGQRIFQRFILPRAHITLTQDFHSNNCFSGSLHFAQHAHYSVRL